MASIYLQEIDASYMQMRCRMPHASRQNWHVERKDDSLFNTWPSPMSTTCQLHDPLVRCANDHDDQSGNDSVKGSYVAAFL